MNWRGLLKLIRTAGTPEGCRESTRLSYDQHLRAALKGRGPRGEPPHHVALYGALATWYKVRRLPVREASLWGELAPFLLLAKTEAREAIAEYTVYLEDREGRWGGLGRANVNRLAELLNRGLRSAEPAENSPISLAIVVGLMNHVAWCDLLAPDVRDSLKAEALKLGQALEQDLET